MTPLIEPSSTTFIYVFVTLQSVCCLLLLKRLFERLSTPSLNEPQQTQWHDPHPLMSQSQFHLQQRYRLPLSIRLAFSIILLYLMYQLLLCLPPRRHPADTLLDVVRPNPNVNPPSPPSSEK